ATSATDEAYSHGVDGPPLPVYCPWRYCGRSSPRISSILSGEGELQSRLCTSRRCSSAFVPWACLSVETLPPGEHFRPHLSFRRLPLLCIPAHPIHLAGILSSTSLLEGRCTVQWTSPGRSPSHPSFSLINVPSGQLKGPRPTWELALSLVLFFALFSSFPQGPLPITQVSLALPKYPAFSPRRRSPLDSVFPCFTQLFTRLSITPSSPASRSFFTVPGKRS
ncbi:hypothetical protein CORC01_07968, partial [Colletotrichum orchidophilum]